MLNSHLLKPFHEYTCTLSLKLPQFCCSWRHCFGKDPRRSPYLLQVINPSFSQSLAWLHLLDQHPPRGKPSFLGNSTLVTIDEPTLTHYNHPKSIAYIGVHSWCCTIYGLDKYVMTCIHHYNIIQSSFTALKVLCAFSIHPSLYPKPLATTDLLLSP